MRAVHQVVDVVAVVTLSALALIGLDDSFSSRSYLVSGMAGVLAVSVWALICTVQRFATGTFLLVFSVGFPVLGATAALHNYDLLGFPSPRSVADLLSATITAPGEFLTTIPPVDASGRVLVIPYVIGFVLCGPAAWLALRLRRPLVPAIPVVLAAVACIVLGTENPVELGIRSVGFAAVLIAWVAARAARHRVGAYPHRGRTLRAVIGTAVAVGAVMLSSQWLPGVPSQDRDVLRGRVGSGQDVSQIDNPLASFRKFTDQPAGAADNVADKRLLKVSGLPRRDLLRFVALDVYDGTEWVAANRTVADDSAALFQRIGERVAASRRGDTVDVAVEVKKPWTSSWLPLTGQLTGITFDYLDGEAQREDVRYNVATSTGMVVGGLQGRDDYHFAAEVPDTTLTREMTPYGSGAALQPSGEFLDEDLKPWRSSGLTPVRQVYSLARYLRTNGRYSDGGKRLEVGYLPGHSQQRLGPGFFGARSIVGDDEQYAAFMALAANRLGVPARVVVGAVPDRQGWVLGRSVLVWVELRVADGSWRVLPTDRFMSHQAPDGVDVRPTPESYVRSTTSAATSPPQLQPQQPANGQLPTVVETVSHRWGIFSAPLVLLLVGILPVIKLLRRRRRRRAPSVSARFVGGWAELTDLARDLSREVPDLVARTEQARRLGLSLELARQADAHVFAREEPAAEAAAEFWRDVAQERGRYLREAGMLKRVRWWWVPTSLVRSLKQNLRRGPGPGAGRWLRAGRPRRWWRARTAVRGA